MCCGSGTQAEIAATQAASENQRQAFEEALAFNKQQFAEAKQNRAPYLRVGGEGLTALEQLLGLTPTISATGSGNNATGNGNGLRGTAGGNSNIHASGGLQGVPLGPLETFPSGLQGRNYPPGGDPNTGHVDPTGGGGTSLDSIPAGTGANGLPNISGAVSGGQNFSATLADDPNRAVQITDRTGKMIWVPQGLVPYWQR